MKKKNKADWKVSYLAAMFRLTFGWDDTVWIHITARIGTKHKCMKWVCMKK